MASPGSVFRMSNPFGMLHLSPRNFKGAQYDSMQATGLREGGSNLYHGQFQKQQQFGQLFSLAVYFSHTVMVKGLVNET